MTVASARVVGLTAAQDGLHPGDELARAERLGDVVVGAELEAEDAVDLAVAGGEEQHRHVARGAQSAAHLEAVDVGQADVEQHDLRPMLRDQLEPAFAVRGLQHSESGLAQVHVEQVGDVRIVLDHHDGALALRHVGHAATLVLCGSWPWSRIFARSPLRPERRL